MLPQSYSSAQVMNMGTIMPDIRHESLKSLRPDLKDVLCDVCRKINCHGIAPHLFDLDWEIHITILCIWHVLLLNKSHPNYFIRIIVVLGLNYLSVGRYNFYYTIKRLITQYILFQFYGVLSPSNFHFLLISRQKFSWLR